MECNNVVQLAGIRDRPESVAAVSDILLVRFADATFESVVTPHLPGTDVVLSLGYP
jgi:hypothetical protein